MLHVFYCIIKLLPTDVPRKWTHPSRPDLLVSPPWWVIYFSLVLFKPLQMKIMIVENCCLNLRVSIKNLLRNEVAARVMKILFLFNAMQNYNSSAFLYIFAALKIKQFLFYCQKTWLKSFNVQTKIFLTLKTLGCSARRSRSFHCVSHITVEFRQSRTKSTVEIQKMLFPKTRSPK